MRTCYAFITLLLFSSLFIGCSDKGVKPLEPRAEAISEAIAEGERTVLTSRVEESLEKSFFDLKSARNPEKRDFLTEVTFSKVAFHYGSLVKDGEAKEKIWESGVEAGRIASRLESEKPDGFYWAAANLNALSKKSPLTIGIKSIDDLRTLAAESVRLDPGFEHGDGLNILAQVELFTGLVGGKPSKAVEYLEQAIKYDTRDGSMRLSLAEAYLLTRRNDDARRVLREILEMKSDPNYVKEHEAAVAKAKRMLERRL
jgi:predicted Zn-dependent protease